MAIESKIVRLTAVALGLGAIITACSGDSEKSGGLTPTNGTAGSGSSSGGTSSVTVDGGVPDSFVPGPPTGGSSSAGSGGGYGIPNCTGLDMLGECGATTVQAEFEPINILLVIDKSGSMEDQPDGFDTDKWSALKSALTQALGNLSGDINLGLALYPYSLDHEIDINCSSGCCEVPAGAAAVNVGITAGTTAVPAVLGALDATSPGGGTPTAAALAGALDYFTSGDGAALAGDKYVLLATDGGPNCNAANSCDATSCTVNLDGLCTTDNCCINGGELCLDDQNVVAQIDALTAAGIATFVVGIPGTEQYASYLDLFATAGGVPNPNAPPSYYAVSASGGVQALADTFTQITTHLVRSCEVTLAEAPPNNELVNVAIDCEVVPFEDGAGWEIPPDSSTVLLKGDACEWVETQGAKRIDVVYGCPTLR